MRALVLAALLVPAIALGQIRISGDLRIDLPAIVPPLVVIEPGIRVVPDVDVEVFHVDGFYWTRHEGRWYRSDNPRHGWVHRPRGIPPGLLKIKPGKYRRWRPEARERAMDRREDRREWEEDRREHRREWREDRGEREREREHGRDRRERAKDRDDDRRERRKDRRERD